MKVVEAVNFSGARHHLGIAGGVASRLAHGELFDAPGRGVSCAPVGTMETLAAAVIMAPVAALVLAQHSALATGAGAVATVRGVRNLLADGYAPP